MEAWLRDHGKPRLVEALTEAWSRVEDDYQQDYQDAYHAASIEKAELQVQLQVLRARVAKVERLEQQNKTLKGELVQLKKSNQNQWGLSKSITEPRTPLAPLPVNEVRSLRASVKHDSSVDANILSHDDLLAAYSKLEEKYTKLRAQFANSVGANEELQRQCRETHDAYVKWQQHGQTLEKQVAARNKRIEKLKSHLAVATGNDTSVTSSLCSDVNTVVKHGQGLPESHLLESNLALTKGQIFWPPEIQSDAHRETSVLGSTDSERAPSLPPLPAPKIGAIHHSPADQPSSDGVVVVSERPVRKRRREEGYPGQEPAPTRVKTEGSSDPVMVDEQHHFRPQESIDFDNAEERILTPRKGTDGREGYGSTSPSPTQDRNHALAAVHNSMSAHVQEREQAAALWRENVMLNKTTKQMDYDTIPGRASGLRQLSDKTLPKTLARKPNSKATVSETLRRGIANLAEDHDSLTPSGRRGRSTETGRLQNLLNTASTEPAAITPTPGVRAAETRKTNPVHISLPDKRTPSTTQRTKTSKVSDSLRAPETPPLSHSNRTPTASHPKPLRDRSVWSLKRSDFKVNPKYNSGSTFAFSDVIRGKERESLPGCSKEECCGKLFRPLALVALDTTGEFQMRSTLEGALGDDAWRLSQMSKKEMEDMWVEEKIKELSNKHGRHRERYAAMREPAGWTRMGFPSTQEDIADRAENLKRERLEVEEKYEEAKKKGKWLFADEDP